MNINVIVVHMMNHVQVYTNRYEAERAMAHFIVNEIYAGSFRLPKTNLKDLYNKERYAEVVNGWNEFAMNDQVLRLRRPWHCSIKETKMNSQFNIKL